MKTMRPSGPAPSDVETNKLQWTGQGGLPHNFPQQESQLPRPPNYKQEKKRREEQQKKKNEEKQREIAERRKPPADPLPP